MSLPCSLYSTNTWSSRLLDKSWTINVIIGLIFTVGNKCIYSGCPPVSRIVMMFSTSPGWCVIVAVLLVCGLVLEDFTRASKLANFLHFTELWKSPPIHYIILVIEDYASCCISYFCLVLTTVIWQPSESLGLLLSIFSGAFSFGCFGILEGSNTCLRWVIWALSSISNQIVS